MKKKKAPVIISLITVIVLCYASGLFPIENIFISFHSPQDVFHYTCSGTIEHIEYGDESCMVVYTTEDGTYSYIIFPKTSKGYQIPGILTLKTVSSKLQEPGSFELLRIANTSDFYVFGMCILDEGNLTDSNHSDIKVVIPDNRQKESKIMFAFVGDASSGYYIVADNKKIIMT